MVEVRGREIRTSQVDSRLLKGKGSDPNGVFIKVGTKVYLACDTPSIESDQEKFNVSYRDLPRLVKPNDIIYVDDGKIVLLVTECDRDGVSCEVKGEGVLGHRKNLKLPAGKHEHQPIMTPEEVEEISGLLKRHKIDYISIPYAVRKRDITTVRELIGHNDTQLLAKIDTVESIHNFEELIKAADGIIINRVELGLEIHAEKLMLAQKWMIDRACQEGKPCFVASQVLESMVREPVAHRQDAEDVTSAVLEGVDAFVLSHETAIGQYPVDAVVQLAKCIAEGENILDYE